MGPYVDEPWPLAVSSPKPCKLLLRRVPINPLSLLSSLPSGLLSGTRAGTTNGVTRGAEPSAMRYSADVLSSCWCATAACLAFFRRKKKKAMARSAMAPRTPPTTLPTIAPREMESPESEPVEVGFAQLADPKPELVLLETCEDAPVESVMKTARRTVLSQEVKQAARDHLTLELVSTRHDVAELNGVGGLVGQVAEESEWSARVR